MVVYVICRIVAEHGVAMKNYAPISTVQRDVVPPPEKWRPGSTHVNIVAIQRAVMNFSINLHAIRITTKTGIANPVRKNREIGMEE